MTTLLLIAKQPIAGLVKTRLCPPCTHEEAARLADAALDDTVRTARVTGADRLVVAYDGDPDDRFEGWVVVGQRGDGLADRLGAAFADAGAGPTLLIGMDTPQVPVEVMRSALCSLQTNDAVFGAAPDGGFWAIGFRAAPAGVFEGVPMSCPNTGAIQLARLQQHFDRIAMLPRVRDVDTIEDAHAVAAASPATGFAAALAAVERGWERVG